MVSKNCRARSGLSLCLAVSALVGCRLGCHDASRDGWPTAGRPRSWAGAGVGLGVGRRRKKNLPAVGQVCNL